MFLVRTLLYNVPCKLLVSIIAIRISLQREKVSAQLIETVSKKFALYFSFHWLIEFGLPKVAQDSGTHDSKTEQAEEVKIFNDQFLVILN